MRTHRGLYPGVVPALLGVALTLASALPADAQTRRFTIDLTGALDDVAGSTPDRHAAAWFDAFAAARIANGLTAVARPLLVRRTFDGAWQKQMYQLGVQYERPGRLGIRLEAGYMSSPIGVALLENRPDLNPVVSQHSAYYLRLPPIDPEIPRVFLIGATYPLGAQATFAGRRWDARVAAIDSSPVRGRSFFNAGTQPRLLNAVVGGGFTPRIGLRVGAALARGAYASVNEVRDRSRGDRDATVAQVEGEWAFGHTRLTGEWIHTNMETARAAAVARGGWMEIVQTLTPRVFVAGRVDSQRYAYQRPATLAFEQQRYHRIETIAGLRLTPDLTLRGGYMVRAGYVVAHWDDQVIGSVVWQKRLW